MEHPTSEYEKRIDAATDLVVAALRQADLPVKDCTEVLRQAGYRIYDLKISWPEDSPATV
jgi:hypothetical protein